MTKILLYLFLQLPLDGGVVQSTTPFDTIEECQEEMNNKIAAAEVLSLEAIAVCKLESEERAPNV